MHTTNCLVQCEEMIREGSSTFYKAFGFLPSPRKEAVYVIYAFCRMIDDSVDEPEKSMYTIDELEQSLNELHSAEGHFIWPALRWLFEKFPNLDKAPFYKQMEGQRRDLVQSHYNTLEELEHYCYLVAGTVGEMLLPVLHDNPDAEVTESGIYLGKAMQIVNIVRDIGEDLERGRRYVPLELMEQCGYSEEDFYNKVVNPSLTTLIDELEMKAKAWFSLGMRNLDSYPKSSAFSVELAALFYGGILDAVKNNDYQVFTERAYVNKLQKTSILVSVARRYGMSMLKQESSAVS
ncbi:phytoene/squalene synthase family protein [Paenibacillus lemnae]|uniref:Squalene/phytoene synthase family protein n=1 Tax=Paenibacillus lemnae TaxID=1330551 RepID=A0A848MAR9_PAELE|nr:phytoene/squalene synthase family protein [Paenibacillus lemnae]NMO97053.1 squalene/phytoene synthase family protein [Paenibacillus lemnae]